MIRFSFLLRIQRLRFSEGTGLGVPWPGEDFAILVFAALFLMVALIAVALMRRDGAQALP